MRADTELEISVIGALCIEPRAIGRISPLLVPEDFTSEACRTIYKAACEAQKSGTPFDAVIAREAVSSQLGVEGSDEFIRHCINITPSTVNAEYHASLLHGRSSCLRLRNALMEDIAGAYTGTGTDLAATVMNRCRAFLEAEQTGRSKDLVKVLADLCCELGEHNRLIRVDTGFPVTDGFLEGINSGNLCLIGARPGIGKTALALNIAEHVAATGGGVLIFSMEMLAPELAERMIARRGQNRGINLDVLIKNRPTPEQHKAINTISVELSKLSIRINDAPNMTVSKIRAEAAAMDNLHLIIVDFLSLMKSEVKVENRNLELGAISRDLKNLASELQVPVIALTQLNRGTTDTEAPGLRSLRDSGELEQNANKVLLLWYIDKETHRIGLSVEKNRRGKTGTVEFHFDGDHMQFAEVGEYHKHTAARKSFSHNIPESMPWLADGRSDDADD